jgi:Rieske Fe-S protein
MDVTSDNPVSATRRTVMAMAGATGLAAALAACGGSDGSGSGSAATSSDGGTASSGGTGSSGASGSSGSGSSGSSGSGGSSSGGTALAKTSEIPEGGGKIFAAEKVVVTQPASGQFKCFSAICTHLGCTVAEVKDGTIDCPCHGSKYRISDGHVVGGPAPAPLPAKKITVSGGEITLD